MLLLLFGVISSNIRPVDKNQIDLHHQQTTGDKQSLDNLQTDTRRRKAVEDPETGLMCLLEEKKTNSLERETLLSCTHSTVNICHQSFLTQFRPSSEKVCEEIYKKSCRIVFSRRPTNQTVEHCYTPAHTCPVTGGERETCREVLQSSCLTRYSTVHRQWGTKCS